MLIVHRCTGCDKPDYWTPGADRSGSVVQGGTIRGQKVTAETRVRTCCRGAGWGPPETAPRWTGAHLGVTPTPVTQIAEPGTRHGPWMQSPWACACDDCRELYAELVGRATAQLGAPT